MSNQEDRLGRLSRRDFLRNLFVSSLALDSERFLGRLLELRPSLYPSPEYLKTLVPNPKAGLVNCPMLPDSIYYHNPQEPFLVNINFNKMYSLQAPDRPNINPAQFGDLEGYGQGIREAIKRGVAVYLVLDFPWQKNNRLIAPH